jgi:hypothetical protein
VGRGHGDGNRRTESSGSTAPVNRKRSLTERNMESLLELIAHRKRCELRLAAVLSVELGSSVVER